MTKKHSTYPQGLTLIFILSTFGMVGLMMMVTLLVLYCTEDLNVPLAQAYTFFGAFISLFYTSSLLGGYLGGRHDYKLAIISGALLAGLGSFCVALPEHWSLVLGTATFIIGGGLLYPNVQSLLSRMFAKEDPLRDSGFTIAYIGANVGGLFASLASGFIARDLGFGTAFVIGGICLWIAALLLILRFHRIQFHSEAHLRAYRSSFSWKDIGTIFLAILVFIPIVATLLHHARFSNICLIGLGGFMSIVVIYLASKEHGFARRKLFGFLIFLVFGLAFWTLYTLTPAILTIFVKNNVDRQFGNFLFPAASVYTFNPIFIVLLGSLTSLYFLKASRDGRHISLRYKFATGIISMAIGYLILVPGIFFAHTTTGLIAFYWIVASYFFQTLGELFIGPIGFSMVGSLVPTRLEGMMMGVFQLSTGVAGAISGFLAERTAVPEAQATHPSITNPIFLHAFALYGSISLATGILILLLGPLLKRLWGDGQKI